MNTASLLYTGTPRENLIQEWRDLGFSVISRPLFSYQKMDFLIPDLNTFHFCIISSQRTVQILKRYFPNFLKQEIEFYVVGRKTSALLEEFGVSISEIGEKGFLSIKDKLPRNQRGIFFGAKELAEPARMFVEQNPLVEHIPVYKQLQNELDLDREFDGHKILELDGIIATSPKGIEIIGRNERVRELVLFVLGDTSEKKAKEMGFSNVLKCSTPQLENITEVLLKYFQSE